MCLLKQASLDAVARDAPLTRDEEALWRALMKVIITLPRVLDDDLRGAGLSLSEYVTLVNLSEAENHERRMSDLASAIQLSASRVSRLVEELQSRGFVEKRRASEDGRGNVTSLTPAGLRQLKLAYPDHLRSARARVIDQLDPKLVKPLGAQISQVAQQLGAL
jgi:DNA-binding MarR family transcriptional regulator